MPDRRDRAVSVVFDGRGSVLVVRRWKDGREYCVLPGGAVEPGEEPEEAAVRELREETGLAGEVVRALRTMEHADRIAHYFLVATETGPVRLGGPELESQSETNRHLPAWVLLTRLDTWNLQPEELRSLLLGGRWTA